MRIGLVSAEHTRTYIGFSWTAYGGKHGSFCYQGSCIQRGVATLKLHCCRVKEFPSFSDLTLGMEYKTLALDIKRPKEPVRCLRVSRSVLVRAIPARSQAHDQRLRLACTASPNARTTTPPQPRKPLWQIAPTVYTLPMVRWRQKYPALTLHGYLRAHNTL